MTEELAECLRRCTRPREGHSPSTSQARKARATLTFGARSPSTSRAAPSPPRGAFTLVPGIMDMGVAKSPTVAQAPVGSTFDEINRMFSKLGFIDYNSRLAQGPFYSPNLICLSHVSRRRGGAFSRESIPVLLMRPNMPLRMLGRRFRNFKTIRFSKLSGNKLSVRFFIKCKKAPP